MPRLRVACGPSHHGLGQRQAVLWVIGQYELVDRKELVGSNTAEKRIVREFGVVPEVFSGTNETQPFSLQEGCSATVDGCYEIARWRVPVAWLHGRKGRKG